MDIKTTAHAANEVVSKAAFVSNENIVYLMGLSFMIGSLFTIFILVLLDFMKRDRGIDK